MASSSRARSSSPFSHRKSSTPYSSTSSSLSFLSRRPMPRSCSSASSFLNSGRSMTPSRGRSESMYCGPPGYGSHSPVGEREYQRGDEIAWYADGDKIVRNEYNPATFCAFDRLRKRRRSTTMA
ncbi:hypothetical protein QN277_005787 [Acacia crassicarpa]|uniref:Uncharacterized protein n=1 Tax=Acacia crassicarpa TaxID=499986 RepID=A0AAE1IXV5_9FABA|nr:hypothetical protein QN277_005787 [Acacia crassicarpa]